MRKIAYSRGRYPGGTEHRLLFLRGACREIAGIIVLLVALLAFIWIAGTAQTGGTISEGKQAAELSEVTR
jgi:hypothetical protein